jgi:NAD(P)-dependent dehydrogenase (short-subunit alcohol dehydrogenase family)
MLIQTSSLSNDSLTGKVAIVTGAGGGIGFEAARALAWLGAKVAIAEINAESGPMAAKQINDEFADGTALWIQADVSDEDQVESLKRKALERFGKVDIVLNNATITPLGRVQEVTIDQWDASYGVNLRGPVLMAQAFLPGMIERDQGVFVCVSSVGDAYMGAYESFKAAQVHLASTLDAELEGTGVIAFTIGPGLVRTPGSEAGIAQLAPLLGQTVDEFFENNQEHILSVEAAGVGFAAAIVLASQYWGQEIGANQALVAVGIGVPGNNGESPQLDLMQEERQRALQLCRGVHQTLDEQSQGWSQRSIFERHWMLRDFKKNAGMPVEQWLAALREFELVLEDDSQQISSGEVPPLDRLAAYYEHMQELARGYEKDPAKLTEQLQIIQSWKNEVEQLYELFQG